eukprot:scpid92706/ scgid21827/ 
MASYYVVDNSAEIANSEAMDAARSFTVHNPYVPNDVEVYHANDSAIPDGQGEQVYVMSADTSRMDPEVAQLDQRAENSASGQVQTLLLDTGTPWFGDVTHSANSDVQAQTVINHEATNAYSSGSSGATTSQQKRFASNSGY